MPSDDKNGLANRPVIVIIGLLAACITIFAFLTGRQTVGEALGAIIGSGRPADRTQAPRSQSATYSQTPTPLALASPVVASTWKNLGLVGEPISDVASADGVVYVATDGAKHGVFKSEDLGTTWKAINNGLLSLDILQVEVSPRDPNSVFVVDGDLWKSDDGGSTWFRISQRSCTGARSMALGSNDARKLYWSSSCLGLFVSNSSGEAWEEFESRGFYKLLSAPSDRDVLYAVKLDGNAWIHSRTGTTETVERVVPGGEWLPLANVGPGLIVLDLTIALNDPLLLFVGTPSGVYRSQDGGGSWVPVNGTLPGQGAGLACNSVHTSPWLAQEVFAVCNGRIYRTQDLGNTWIELESPQGVTLIHLVEQPRVLLAATEVEGIFSHSQP